MRLEAHGLGVDVPPSWEGEIYQREPAAFERSQAGTTRPVVHLANFVLPLDRGDYGSHAVELMEPGDTFVAFLEFEPAAAARALFGTSGVPRLTGDEFGRNNLQRPLPRQAGVQSFFSLKGRAFCLYAVVGDYHDRYAATVDINGVLETFEASG